ncbi:uncharacterized protein LOC131381275 [Hylobates moloch]|uniref:uncharacterized protein LOC131381275 n=1 Tax=Hylobates moloch TaxID=81572 RepID=UPI002676791B|nr:uncharacterized protein LOC131381275 [Hylobates moloch]
MAFGPIKDTASLRPQQNPGPPGLPQGDAKRSDAKNPGPAEWIFEAGLGHRATPELQRKIRQVEDTLEALNEEFFQLTVQALELQKEEKRPNPLPPGEGGVLMVAPNIFPCEWQEDRSNPLEAGGPGGEKLGIWALKSDKALELEVRRVQLAQRIEDLEWELSLLLQVAAGSSSAGGSWSSQHASPGITETHRMLQWPPVGGVFSTGNTARFPW